MGPLLYLDTARLGQTLPAARDAQIDFVRLTTEEPSSLYFEEFLKHGYAAWPDYYQHRFPGLSTWTGVAGLKQSLKQFAGAPHDSEVLLASRSLALVQMAATQMFQACRNVLCTDLSWSTYQDTIEHQATITGNQTTTAPLRDFIFHHGWTADDVANYLADAYQHHHCDGLFLPAVDHLGIRVPVKQIVDRIRQQNSIRYTFIDAAQAFCHVPIEEDLQVADFVVTGCHKWMRAGQPMGVGFYRSDSVYRLTSYATLSVTLDPLQHFTNQLESDWITGHCETISLTSMFACSGAIRDAIFDPKISIEHDIKNQANHVPTPDDSWIPICPRKEFRSRIVLFLDSRSHKSGRTADSIRRAWLRAGCIISAYDAGQARISAPVPDPVEADYRSLHNT